MYKSKIITSIGDVLYLDYEHGFAHDITPLSGMNVELSTEQGFQQVGESVKNKSVKGQRRIISGVVWSPEAEQKLIDTLLPDTSGELIVNDRYICDFVMSKLPEVVHPEGDPERDFIFEIFCPIPFWRTESGNIFDLTRIEPMFEFPVVYDEHMFGQASDGYLNCYNPGAVSVPFELSILASGDCSNFVFTDLKTLDELRLNIALKADERLVLNTHDKNNELTLIKIDALGNKTNASAALPFSSKLLELRPHDNLIKFEATNKELASAIIAAPIYYSGVVV